MEQAGEVDYLITWRDEFVGRVSLTPCRRAGANRRRFAFPKSPSCLRLCLYLPALISRRSCVRAAPPQTHQRITDLVVPNEAHGLFKCPCHAAPPLHLTGVQSCAHDVALSLPLSRKLWSRCESAHSFARTPGRACLARQSRSSPSPLIRLSKPRSASCPSPNKTQFGLTRLSGRPWRSYFERPRE